MVEVKLEAFDIETAKPFPEDHNWRSIRPMGPWA